MGRLVYLFILLLGIGLSVGIRWKYRSDLKTAAVHYRAESHATTAQVGQVTQKAADQIYQGLRTIARLPGIRMSVRVGGHPVPLSADTQQAAQEIYNNFATHVEMAEVCVVP